MAEKFVWETVDKNGVINKKEYECIHQFVINKCKEASMAMSKGEIGKAYNALLDIQDTVDAPFKYHDSPAVRQQKRATREQEKADLMAKAEAARAGQVA